MHNVNDYYLPLKDGKELPCFCYDLANYCEILMGIIPTHFPKYLAKYGRLVSDYAKQVKQSKPKSFPAGYRVYIVDYRLNVLFASVETSGKTATSFSKYGKYGHDIEDYYYGDGELLGDAWPIGDGYNKKEMFHFLSQFGFLPIEELSMSSALVFEQDTLVEQRLLSTCQTTALMERYRKDNFIDWKARVRSIKNVHPYF